MIGVSISNQVEHPLKIQNMVLSAPSNYIYAKKVCYIAWKSSVDCEAEEEVGLSKS